MCLTFVGPGDSPPVQPDRVEKESGDDKGRIEQTCYSDRITDLVRI